MYDYAIGGKDNYAADRNLVAELARILPGRNHPAAENRRFLQRAVHRLLDLGIRQFIDLGCGLPTRRNVHDIVHAVAPNAAVVYVDHDPVAVRHYQALLSSATLATAFQGDLRRPKETLDHPDMTSLIDLDRPVGVLALGILHLISDEDDPGWIMSQLRDTMAPGSILVLTHMTADGNDRADVADLLELAVRMRETMVMRPREQILAFFNGLEFLDPGLVHAADWRPQMPSPSPSGWLLAGAARKA
jgi:hypothetical protein